jgi:hypothetical protein
MFLLHGFLSILPSFLLCYFRIFYLNGIPSYESAAWGAKWQITNDCSVLVANTEGKRPVGETVDWVCLAVWLRTGTKWYRLVNRVKNFLLLWSVGNAFTRWRTIKVSSRTMLHGVSNQNTKFLNHYAKPHFPGVLLQLCDVTDVVNSHRFASQNLNPCIAKFIS